MKMSLMVYLMPSLAADKQKKILEESQCTFSKNSCCIEKGTVVPWNFVNFTTNESSVWYVRYIGYDSIRFDWISFDHCNQRHYCIINVTLQYHFEVAYVEVNWLMYEHWGNNYQVFTLECKLQHGDFEERGNVVTNSFRQKMLYH